MEGFQILLIRLLVFLSHSSHSISGCCLIKVFYVTLYPPGLLPEFLLWRWYFWGKKKKNYVTRSLALRQRYVLDFQGSLAILYPGPVYTPVHCPENTFKRFHILQPCVLWPPCSCHNSTLLFHWKSHNFHIFTSKWLSDLILSFYKIFYLCIYWVAVGHSCNMQNLFSWSMRDLLVAACGHLAVRCKT